MSPLRGAERTTRRPLRFRPHRDDLVDAAAVLVLGVIAFTEFHSTFAGFQYLVVAVLGVALGMVITHFANVLRQPVIVVVVAGVAAFFLLGGAVALRSTPGAGPVPTLGTLRGLVDGSVDGWRDLLTTLPPVDGAGPLLVLPYILGLFLGLGGFSLARRTHTVFWPVVPPLLVFVAVMVLGSLAPGATILTAAGFAVVALAWMAERHRRRHPVSSRGSGRLVRGATVVALFGVAACAAYLAGPLLPGVGSHGRVVLRKYVTPPFTVGDYPSPLGEYRLYAQQRTVAGRQIGLKDTELFTVSGSLPAGSTITFATLDSYNGSVWAATNEGGVVRGKPDSFLRVGNTLDNPTPGSRYTMHVVLSAYDDYWLPTAGAVQKIDFGGPQATRNATDFRYNLATGSGIVPGKVGQGDSYDLTVAGVKPQMLTAGSALSTGGDASAGAFLHAAAASLASTQGTPAAQVLALAGNLKKQGRFTSGQTGSGLEYYLPGHAQGRLVDFVDGVIPGIRYVGDDEQFAAAFALMVEQTGVPARVVVGVESTPTGGVVRGGDVTAWVQVRAADGSWLTVPSAAFTSTTPPDKRQLQQKTQQDAGSNVPPPAQGRPKSTLDDAAASVGDSREQQKDGKHGGSGVPAWVVLVGEVVGLPVLALLVVVGAIVGAKVWRRRRRRTRGTPDVRLVAGWRELLDHSRDLGQSVPPLTTRREQAEFLGGADIADLAMFADRVVFSPGSATTADVEEFWSRVDASRHAMSSAVSRLRRWRARLSLVTFVRPRRRARSDRGITARSTAVTAGAAS